MVFFRGLEQHQRGQQPRAGPRRLHPGPVQYLAFNCNGQVNTGRIGIGSAKCRRPVFARIQQQARLRDTAKIFLSLHKAAFLTGAARQ